MTVPDKVRNLLDQQSIVSLATAASDGTPNTAPIFWKFWYDESTLLLLDNYMNTTKSNVVAAGKASVSVWNTESGEAYQVKGSAEYVSEGLYMDAAVEHMGKQKPGQSPKGAVVIRVDKVYIQTPGEHAGEQL